MESIELKSVVNITGLGNLVMVGAFGGLKHVVTLSNAINCKV